MTVLHPAVPTRDLFVRFSDLPECHRTFFIAGPSNNLIEFKHYDEERFVY